MESFKELCEKLYSILEYEVTKGKIKRNLLILKFKNEGHNKVLLLELINLNKAIKKGEDSMKGYLELKKKYKL